MIVGFGTDIADIERLTAIYNRYGLSFLRKILTPAELEVGGGRHLLSYTAGRFAAKEATVKALGTGFALGIGLRHIEVLNNESGAPFLALKEAALKRAHALGARKFFVSISHERRYAIATVILEGD